MKPLILAALTLITAFTTSLWAETRYVTDEFKVTLRSGTSTSNSIITMLKSGESVQTIKQDNETKYTLIETSKGKQGYILTRFLDVQPSGRQLYSQLQQKSQQQKETIKSLTLKLSTLNSNKSDIDKNLESTSELLLEATSELNLLKETTKDTIAVIKENKTQQTLIQQLEQEKAQLITENNDYKDSTAIDWFIRGAGMFLLAFLIGILVTRIRWKKRDSWGEF